MARQLSPRNYKISGPASCVARRKIVRHAIKILIEVDLLSLPKTDPTRVSFDLAGCVSVASEINLLKLWLHSFKEIEDFGWMGA